MPRKYRDQYTGTNIEIHTEIFHVLRPDLKICWFAVTQPGLQETSRSILKFVFSDKHIILAMFTLDLDPRE